METGDLGILLNMARAEGWSSDLFEFKLYCKLNPGGCFTLVVDNRVRGGVMTFTYPNSGWIGNLIVDRKYRQKGFGKALFRKALQHLSYLPAIFLCASPMAVGLYSQFGFRKISNVNRWESRSLSLGMPERNRDLERVFAMDRKYWREDRSLMLSQMLTNRTIVCNEGAWLGFGQVDDHWTIGPWEANDRDSALGLLKGVVAAGNSQHILLDVPAYNIGAWEILTATGFEAIGRTVLMCRGLLPDIAFDNIYGLASMGSKG